MSCLAVLARPPFQRSAFAFPGRVIVAHDLQLLGVPLARGHHVGPGIFQHRNQKRQYITLGVHILDGTVQPCPLPGPAAVCRTIHRTVTLPKCYISVSQAFIVALGAFLTNERPAACLARVLHRIAVASLGPSVVPGTRGYQFVQGYALAGQVSGPESVARRLDLPVRLLPEPFKVPLSPRPSHYVIGKYQVQFVPVPAEILYADLPVPAHAPLNLRRQRVGYNGEFFLARHLGECLP